MTKIGGYSLSEKIAVGITLAYLGSLAVRSPIMPSENYSKVNQVTAVSSYEGKPVEITGRIKSLKNKSNPKIKLTLENWLEAESGDLEAALLDWRHNNPVSMDKKLEAFKALQESISEPVTLRGTVKEGKLIFYEMVINGKKYNLLKN